MKFKFYFKLPIGRMDRKTTISLENDMEYVINRTELSQNVRNTFYQSLIVQFICNL